LKEMEPLYFFGDRKIVNSCEEFKFLQIWHVPGVLCPTYCVASVICMTSHFALNCSQVFLFYSTPLCSTADLLSSSILLCCSREWDLGGLAFCARNKKYGKNTLRYNLNTVLQWIYSVIK